MTIALRCTGVRVRYGGIEVLHGVDLAVPFGALTALVGPNGAGKSTLLNWCAGAPGTATSTGGRLDVARTRSRGGLRLVPSGPNIFPNLTVAENLQASGDPATALDLFPELAPLQQQWAGTLSGGERQLVAVASALSDRERWRVLLVDEPVQGIASALADRVYDALAAAAVAVATASPQRAVLVADPVAQRALRVADFVWHLERGRITFAGEPSQFAQVADYGE